MNGNTLLIVDKVLENFDTAINLTEDEIHVLLNQYHKIIRKHKLCKRIKSGSVLIVGDIHGDFSILKKVVSYYLKNKQLVHLIFLGDIVDRGSKSIACLNLIFSLILKFPKKVHLIRGNHESQSVNSRYGFIDEAMNNGLSEETYNEYNIVFSDMPLAMIHDAMFVFYNGKFGVDRTEEEAHEEMLQQLRSGSF